jgi:hypothetical protein
MIECIELKGKSKTPNKYYLIPSLCNVTGKKIKYIYIYFKFKKKGLTD